MNADGTKVIRLTQGLEGSWSPDGSRIVFLRRGASDLGWDIWVMNADGSEPALLRSSSLEAHPPIAFVSMPTWSPDGSKIAFQSIEVGKEAIELSVMNADGSTTTAVASGLMFDMDATQPPAWSSDGTKLAFTSDGYDVFVVDADGANRSALAPHAAGDVDPVWAPQETP